MAVITRRAMVWLLPALALCAGFSGLGFWQLGRGAWKERLLEAWSVAAQSPARDYDVAVGKRTILPRREDSATPSAIDALPLRIAVRGEWDPKVTVLLDNQRLDESVGAQVYTRFVPSNGGTPLLVGRGWIALAADRRAPAVPAPSRGPLEVSGMLVAPPAVGMRLGAFDPGAPGVPVLNNYLDFEILRERHGALFEGVLQLDPAAPDGFTRRWQALPNTLPPEKHRGYALQWFGLATAVAVIYIVLVLRSRR